MKENNNTMLKGLLFIVVLAMIALGIYYFAPKEDQNTQSVSTDRIILDYSDTLTLYLNDDETVKEIKSAKEDFKTVNLNQSYKMVILDVINTLKNDKVFDERQNSILITIIEDESIEAEAMKEVLYNTLSNDTSLSYIMINTSISDSVKEIANQYAISDGKANLIREMNKIDPSLKIEDLAHLSINDLNLLIYQNNYKLENTLIYATPKNLKIHPVAHIEEIVLSDLNIAKDKIEALSVDFKTLDHKLVYDVKALYDGTLYRYIVHPITQEILEKSKQIQEVIKKDDLITAEKALNIAMSDAGVSDVVDVSIELVNGKETKYYDIEFEHQNIDYEYIVNATDGTIINTGKTND